MNSIMTIHPYKKQGTWKFDDAATGLKGEPFVAGADTILEHLARGRRALTLLFSANPFPGHNVVLEWQREELNGNWYAFCDMEGWLCPALFKYFEKAPNQIYVKVL